MEPKTIRGWLILVGLTVLSACGSTDGTSQTELALATPIGISSQPTQVFELEAPPTPTPAPTPTSLPTATPVPTPTPEPVVSKTLLFSGDVLSHTPVIASALAYGQQSDWAYDYRPMFADVSARVARADLAICVLETPLSVDNTGLTGYPTFNAPRELPDALVDAGYDGCSTASNHSMDRGPSGVRTTLDQMERVGLGHAGMARAEADALAPRIYEVDGINVAHLSWTYGLNGFVLPADEPWLVNVNEVDAILAESGRARSAGADLVVLSIQWGNEYQRDPSTEQLTLAAELTASGVIDLIVGNHVHVVQPVDFVNGVPVIYGLGNSLSNQSDNCCRTGTQDGVMIEVTVEGRAIDGYTVTGMAMAPTWVDRATFVIVDLGKALANPDLDPALRAIYEASMARTTEAIGLLGADVGLSPG